MKNHNTWIMALALIPLINACSLKDQSSKIQAAGDTERLFFSFYQATDSAGYLVVANPGLNLSNAKYCVGDQKSCSPTKGDWIAMKAVQAKSPSFAAFQSPSKLTLTSGQLLTAQADSSSGNKVTSTIKITDKTAVADNLSRGTGGLTGFREYSFTASNGKKSVYKFTMPEDATSKEGGYGVLIYFHGDLGADYDWFYNTLASVAAKNNLIPIAVKSPTSGNFDGGQSGPTWWQDGDNNAIYFDELFKKDILARYNIDKNQVYYTGASGGPTFLSGPWLRGFGYQYRGGGILFCGGQAGTNYPYKSTPGYETGVKLTYYNGTADFLLSGAQQAIAYYKSKGFSVYSEFPAGVGHCGFSAQMGTLLNRFVGGYLGKTYSEEFNMENDAGIINPDASHVFPEVHADLGAYLPGAAPSAK